MQELDGYGQLNLKARHLRLLVSIDTYRNLTQVADVALENLARNLRESLPLRPATRSVSE